MIQKTIVRYRVEKTLRIEAVEEDTANSFNPDLPYQKKRPSEPYGDLTGSKMMADLWMVVVVQSKSFFIFAV